MGNRTSRHLSPGDQNLRGRKSATICPCCDDMINHKEDILIRIAHEEIEDAMADAAHRNTDTSNESDFQ